MRIFLCVLLLLAACSGLALAAAPAGLPFDLMFSGGTIAGSLGGVLVSGTYTGTSASGTWTLTVSAQAFASGSYSCGSAGCTFTGMTLLGQSRRYVFTSANLAGAKAGVLAGLFRTHGAWVSAVAQWAATHLNGVAIGKTVSAAARIEGPVASDGRGGRHR